MNMVGMVNCNKNCQNVFIASLPRSGSTLLGMILNQHPGCFNIGESFYWGKLNPKNEVCTCGLKGCPVLVSVYEKIKDNEDVLKITNVIPSIDSMLQNTSDVLRGQVDKIYYDDIVQSCNGFGSLANTFRQKMNKSIIIDTSSSILMAYGLVRRNNWKVIIITRDPRGIIASMKKAAIRHGKTVSVDLWRAYILDFLQRAELFSNLDNAILVRYEYLCHNPSGVVKKICSRLGISFNAKMLEYRQNRGHVLMANRMRFGDSENILEDKSWMTYLSKEERRVICSDTKLVSAYKKYKYDIQI